MSNNYNKVINEIKASSEFKENLIKNMKQKQLEIDNKNIKKHNLKRKIAAICSVLGLLLGSGLVYAGITGNLKFGDSEIEFSENVHEYTEEVRNQKVEKYGNIIELTSKVCDDGFVILQFDVTLSDEQSRLAEETCGLQYLSFNDEITNEYGMEDTRLAGANYNLIIDGEEYWMRGATQSQVIENEPNKNYTFYQLYFLSNEEIGEKEKFTITLNNIIMKVDEQLTTFEGSFEVELSKSKVLENTTIYEVEDEKIEYERLTQKVDKIIETPMQTLIKLTATLENVTKRNFANLDEEDYIGGLKYEVYNCDTGEELSSFNLITNYKYYYTDGSTCESSNEEGKEFDGFNKYDTEEYLAVAQNDEVKNIQIMVYEVNEYTGTTRNIGIINIDLNTGDVKTSNENQITEVNNDAPINWDIEYIDKKDISEFSIIIPDENYKIIRNYNKMNEFGYPVEIDEDNADFVTYEIDLKDIDSYFQVIVFFNKSAKDMYDKNDLYISGEDGYEPTVLQKKDGKILVLNAFSDYNYNIIKDIIKTINL